MVSLVALVTLVSLVSLDPLVALVALVALVSLISLVFLDIIYIQNQKTLPLPLFGTWISTLGVCLDYMLDAWTFIFVGACFESESEPSRAIPRRA